MSIKKFNEFNESKNLKYPDTLFIFDLDDTLVHSPRFENLAMEILNESVVSIDSLLSTSLNYIKKNKSDVRVDNGRLYVDDPNSEIIVKGNWVRKKTRVYLIAPDRFYYSDLSFPTKTKELADLYNSCENKAIVTARIDVLNKKVIECLRKLGLDIPNQGLYCYPYKNDGVGVWKGKTIVELIKKTGFKNVEYFDDKSKIVNAVVKAVSQELPEINFKAHKVK